MPHPPLDPDQLAEALCQTTFISDWRERADAIIEKLTDATFSEEPHVDDCGCVEGQDDPACVAYRASLQAEVPGG